LGPLSIMTTTISTTCHHSIHNACKLNIAAISGTALLRFMTIWWDKWLRLNYRYSIFLIDETPEKTRDHTLWTIACIILINQNGKFANYVLLKPCKSLWRCLLYVLDWDIESFWCAMWTPTQKCMMGSQQAICCKNMSSRVVSWVMFIFPHVGSSTER
jgi:hypothetical protein